MKKPAPGKGLYHFTPEAIQVIKKDDGAVSTTGRHAPSIHSSETTPSSDVMVPHPAQAVNEQKMHTEPTQKSELIQEGYRLLQRGQMVSDELLAAMNVTAEQAKFIVAGARAREGDFSGYVDLMRDLSNNKRLRDLQKVYEEEWKQAQEEGSFELEKTELLQYNEKDGSDKAVTPKTGIKGIGLQFFASSKDCKTIILPKQEYAHVMSELATNLTEEQMGKSVILKAIGKYIYTFENNGFGEYRIIGKRLVDEEVAKWSE